MLDEFVTEAIRVDDASPIVSQGRGQAPGMQVVEEPTPDGDRPPASAGRIAEFRGLNTAQLLALVHDAGSHLSGAELLAIHDIAAERSVVEGNPPSAGAVALSREVMLAAVGRNA